MASSRYKPGESGNPAGRPKGAKNKVTAEIRDKIAEFINDNVDTIVDDFKAMKPSYRWKLFVELVPFAIPKLSSNDNRIAFEKLTDEELDEIIDTLTKKANEDDE